MAFPTTPAAVTELITAAEFNLVSARLGDTTLGASATSIDFSSIPTIYSGLLMICWLRTDVAAGTFVNAYLRVNNDATATYDDQYLLGQGSSVSGSEAFARTGSFFIGNTTGASALTDLFSAHMIHIPHYANSANQKSATVINAVRHNTTTGTIQLLRLSCHWRSTAAINRLTVLPGSSNFITGSRVSLYGLSQ